MLSHQEWGTPREGAAESCNTEQPSCSYASANIARSTEIPNEGQPADVCTGTKAVLVDTRKISCVADRLLILCNPGFLGLQLPETLASTAGGEGVWEL